jgi:hypothetical protein
MKVRFTTLFLSILFMWGSLFAYGESVGDTKPTQLKASRECVSSTLISLDDADEVKVMHFQDAVPFNTLLLMPMCGQIITNSFRSSLYKPIRAYIVFRALRN